MTPEERAAEEKRRREARKNRILGNPQGRIGFIADQVKDPSQTPPKKIDDDEDDTSLLQQLQNNNGAPASPSQTSGLRSSHEQQDVTSSKSGKSAIRESFRWIGALTFGLLFAYNALVLSSETEHPLQKYIGAANLKSSDLDQMIYLHGPLILLWLAWEYLLGYDRQRYPFFTHIRADISLLAFFYATSVDLILRWIDPLRQTALRPFIPSDLHTGHLMVSGMYIPLFIAFAGQLSGSIIAKILPLAMMGDMVGRIVDGVLQFLIIIVSLLVCVDWWGCASNLCNSMGLLYMISNKSRGLMIWSHICNGVASRVLE